jgi:CDP-glucose 4,6-dehydratase
MDKMEIEDLFGGVYYGKRVFITGHTGFKGSWLALWLTKMGAIVRGYSLAPKTSPNHWELLNLNMESIFGDIGDTLKLGTAIRNFKPDIVFHLAAQAIVRYSYEHPVETYETNIIGTIKLFEACRKVDSIRAIINVTSDKCYNNKEWVYGYRENDAMGGFDPYSSSKGCSEILTSSYRNSYWNIDKYEIEHKVLLASCRAGNVIGGGDWGQDRLIPDIVRAESKGEEVIIRNPYATRPWQHVLDPLSGYLLIGQKLLEQQKSFAKAWNFGPPNEDSIPVIKVLEFMKELWPNIKVLYDKTTTNPHETKFLRLDCSQAYFELQWKPLWTKPRVFQKTAIWYRDYIISQAVQSYAQIDEYVTDAKKQQLIWTK